VSMTERITRETMPAMLSKAVARHFEPQDEEDDAEKHVEL